MPSNLGPTHSVAGSIKSYRGQFTLPVAGPWLDLYLLLVAYPSDEEHTGFLDITGQIIRRLLLADGPTSHLVRRIVALNTALDQDDRTVFSVSFAHGPGAAATPPNV